tara:strand:- start:1611 stop:2261 length:651 start_codon:yes stop_codon:yes gene_type:complete
MKRILIGILFVLAVLFTIYWYFFEYKYYQEFNKVQSIFEQMPLVEKADLKIGNFDLEIEEISAFVILKNGTEIGFSSSIWPEKFTQKSEVNINEFNKWHFQTHNFRKQGENEEYFRGSSIDFGKSGELNDYVNVEIDNISDAINNTDEINNLIEKIPVFPKMTRIEFKSGFYNHIEYIYKIPKDGIQQAIISFENKSDSLYLNSKPLEKTSSQQRI